MVVELESIELNKLVIAIAQQNDVDYEMFLKMNKLEENWGSWDKFIESKWGNGIC